MSLTLPGWRGAFTRDGVFKNIAAGESYSGDSLGDVVTYMANLLPVTFTANCSGCTKAATWSWSSS